ncbi:MAG: hypothetical protein NVV72_03205 [Asticcacaulis sp.]|nr:hypothetical protein [Asticcacaulis sp.]
MTIFQQKNKFRQRCHTLRRSIKLNLTRRENKGFVAREKRPARNARQSGEKAMAKALANAMANAMDCL